MTYSRKELSLDEVFQKYGEPATIKEAFYDWWGLNEWLLFKINHLRGDIYDRFMIVVSDVSATKTFPYYVGVFLVLAVLGGLWRKLRSKGGGRHYVHGWIGFFCVLITAFALNYAMVSWMKSYFAMPRPFVVYESPTALAPFNPNPEYKLHVLESRPHDAMRSFPSGHVAFATLISMSLWPLLFGHWRTLALVWVALVAWSRVSLGVHFPADTVWSFCFTSLLVIGVRAVLYKVLRRIGINCG